MSRYLDANKMMKLSLAEIENLLNKYLVIAEASNWEITKDFENDLKLLTELAKSKGSVRRW